MKRHRRLPLALGVIGLGLTGVVVTWQRVDRTEPVVIRTIGTDAELTITWTGDTMLGDSAEASIATYGHGWPLAAVAPLLVGDVVIANAEAPITLHSLLLRPEKYSYRTDPAAAASLAGVGVSALGLANNHAMDAGAVGLDDSIRHAREAGLATFGAGPNLSDAERPLLVHSDVGTVGVVAMGKDYGSDVIATDDQAGTVAFSSAAIARGYALAKAGGADWVVAFVHWGENYKDVRQSQLAVAEGFAAAGYDLVVGHGPHIVQGIGQVGSMPVVYSLGNFVFGTRGRFAQQGQEGYGLVLNTVFTDIGLSELRLDCIVTDNRQVKFQPVPCSAEEASAVLSNLHGGLVVNGSSARIVLQPDRGANGSPMPALS